MPPGCSCRVARSASATRSSHVSTIAWLKPSSPASAGTNAPASWITAGSSEVSRWRRSRSRERTTPTGRSVTGSSGGTGGVDPRNRPARRLSPPIGHLHADHDTYPGGPRARSEGVGADQRDGLPHLVGEDNGALLAAAQAEHPRERLRLQRRAALLHSDTAHVE